MSATTHTPLEQAVWDVLRSVEDPELPIAITDLGLVRDVHVDEGAGIRVRLVPTWSACPALAVIRTRIRDGLGAIPGAGDVVVEYTYDEPWTLERMTAKGREQLAAHGLAVPACRFAEAPVCPYCGSRDVAMDSLFGPTLCRSTYVCRRCRNPFERFKPPAER
ncbi:MAG TPA: 1,2-phenylacetyl-CoA epoxidase subunit PaaD [bacterium]|nr:1,2-phenylacetyl-CoA epoxidase subunit PaaD [bacterium]